MKKVLICPKCKGWSVNRKGGCCRYCGQRIVIGNEPIFAGDYYWDRVNDSYLSYVKLRDLTAL